MLIDDTTTAELTGTLVGGRNLTIGAATTHLANAHAKTGAAGGKVAVVPSVAIVISNISTYATVDDGSDLSVAAFSVTADQTASATTTAEGDAKGNTAAIGVAVALTIANHRSEAKLLRNLTSSGAVTLVANGTSETSATAKASAAGAPQDASSAAAPADPSGGGSAGDGVTNQVSGERSFANGMSIDNGGKAVGSPLTSTSTASVAWIVDTKAPTQPVGA